MIWHKMRSFVLAGIVLLAGAAACSGDGNKKCSPTLYCGQCHPPIEIYIIDQNTGKLVGWTTGMLGLELVGEKGSCNTSGHCYIDPKDDNQETLYNFEIRYKGQVLGMYSLTALVNEDPGRCCPCPYDTNVVELVVDWAEISK
jgi:hypothetical protein